MRSAKKITSATTTLVTFQWNCFINYCLLLNRLDSPDPNGELDQIRKGNKLLPQRCLALLEKGKPLSDAVFVERAYQSILGREPDEQGFRDWMEALDSGRMSHVQVVTSFLSSTEFRGLLLPS